MSMPFGSERASLLNGLRTSTMQQQYVALGHSPTFHQQQQQSQLAAFYQQQQQELAQQQLALEMQLQLEQLKLHQLFLHEQYYGQQAQTQVDIPMYPRPEGRNVYTAPPQSGRFSLAQGGLAERAIARRFTQDEPPSSSPSVMQNELFTRAHGRQMSASSLPQILRDTNSLTPALILSKPGEAFPSGRTSDKQMGHKHTDSDSSASIKSSLSSFSHSREVSEDDSLSSPPSEIGAFEKGSFSTSPMAKLNPFSSVFVPNGPAPVSSPTLSAVPFKVNRCRADSPNNTLVAGSKPSSGAIALRQPKGPPSLADDLEAQNFTSRLRKRAITNIKALGVRTISPPTSPMPQACAGSYGELKSPGLMTLIQATKDREDRAARVERS